MTNTSRSIRRFRDDSGTALIECSIALPVLVVIIAGIFDFGMVFRQISVIHGAVHSGVRTAATTGSGRQADFLALRAFASRFGQAKNITLVKVVIYRPASEGSAAPINTACFTSLTPPAGAKCNVYTAAMVNTIGSDYRTHFGPDSSSCAATAWDSNWCPRTRIDNAESSPDWIGTYVEVSYKSFTGFWMPGGLTTTHRAVMRVEPKTVAS